MCCLIFDEISVLENLHFNQKFGCIEGFEDFRSHGRQAVLQIMPWSSCCMVNVKSGHNH